MIAERLRSQLLSGPRATSAEAVVHRLLAVQAQDPRGARLSIRARSTGISAAAVDAAFTETRSLLIAWLCRGTLHLVESADYWWLHPLTTPQLVTGNNRRLQQEGVSLKQAERGADVILEQTASGPKTREELRHALEAQGIPTAGQAFVHVLLRASIHSDVVRGPMRGAEHCFVRARDWLGPAPDPLDRPAALALLAQRYLAGHRPATPEDLAKWAGIPLREARAGFADTEDDSEQPSPPPLPPPQLLGAFDPLLLGWASRDFIVGGHKGIITSNGLFRPFALVDGHAVATWKLSAGKLTIQPLEKINKRDLAALEADTLAVLRFLGAD